MKDISTAVLANMIAEEFGNTYDPVVTPNMRADLAQRIEIALRKVSAWERDVCVKECTRRYELWASYDDREVPLSMKFEARERANEACYLAELLRARDD